MSASTTATATGIGLAGMQLICESSAAALTTSVQVNWNGDGTTFVEEKSHLLSYTDSRGRSRLNDVFAAGTATLRLRNDDGRYSPNNVLSPLYPNVVGGRLVKVTCTYHGVVYARFTGTIMEPNQAVVPGYSEMTIQLIDAFERFRLAVADADLQTNQRTDQIISAILTANAWTGGTTLDTGSTLPYYAQPNTNVLQALQDVARNEVGGQVWMGKDGTVVFQNATHRPNAPVFQWLTSAQMTHLDANARQSDLYGQVTVTYAAYTWGAAAASSYSGQQGLAIYPGANVIKDYYSALAVLSVVTPVPETDYIALDQETPPVYLPPGTAIWPVAPVDVTANVLVQTFTTSGTSFTLTFYSSLPYVAWLQSLQIRATAVQTQPNPRTQTVLAPGVPLGVNQTLTQSFNWVQDDARVSAWAMQRAATLSKQHPRPVITVIGKTPALLHFILGADLSLPIILQDSGGAAVQIQ